MIRAEKLTIWAGTFQLDSISFHVPVGAYCVLMGRTGSGKTTLLETICGLKQPVAGSLQIAGRDAAGLKPAQRGIGFVPQDRALFYSMTVRRHLSFALDIRRWPKRKIEARVEELAEMLEIRYLLDRRPHGLSGGEAQRVALGRALSQSPQLLCLDEPLSSLDDETRSQMVGILGRVHQETGVTALHVTHNRHEADQLADLYLRIVDGQIEESTSPLSELAEIEPSRDIDC